MIDYLLGLTDGGWDLLILGIIGAVYLVYKIRKESGNRD